MGGPLKAPPCSQPPGCSDPQRDLGLRVLGFVVGFLGFRAARGFVLRVSGAGWWAFILKQSTPNMLCLRDCRHGPFYPARSRVPGLRIFGVQVLGNGVSASEGLSFIGKPSLNKTCVWSFLDHGVWSFLDHRVKGLRLRVIRLSFTLSYIPPEP